MIKSGHFLFLFAFTLPFTLPPSLVRAASDIDIAGYLDVQWGVNDSNPGARIGRGDISLSQTKGKASILLEIPFFQQAKSSDFSMGADYAQAYLTYQSDERVRWSFGQWDGLFGLERNDTNKIFFTQQGSLFNTQAKTNTGLRLSYSLSPLWLAEAYLSGARDEGSTDSARHPEVGAKFSLLQDSKWTFGGSFRDEGDDVRRLYLNLSLSGTNDGWDWGTELTYARAGRGEAFLGLGLLANYQQSETLRFGLRAQHLSKPDLSVNSMTEVTAGPQFELAPELRLKADVTTVTSKITDGKTETEHRGAIAGVYTF